MEHPEEALEEENAAGDPDGDLAALRWQFADAWADGVTFHGRLVPPGCVLSSRRLAGVPIRFELIPPLEFAGLGSILAGLLGGEEPYLLGEAPPAVVAGEGGPCLPIPVGMYAVRTVSSGEEIRAWVRKTSREEFEVELPWKRAFAEWKVGRPIL